MGIINVYKQRKMQHVVNESAKKYDQPQDLQLQKNSAEVLSRYRRIDVYSRNTRKDRNEI